MGGANVKYQVLYGRVVTVMAVHADAGAAPVVVSWAVEIQQTRVPQDVIALLGIALIASWSHFASDHACAFFERPSKIEGVELLLRSAGLLRSAPGGVRAPQGFGSRRVANESREASRSSQLLAVQGLLLERKN